MSSGISKGNGIWCNHLSETFSSSSPRLVRRSLLLCGLKRWIITRTYARSFNKNPSSSHRMWDGNYNTNIYIYLCQYKYSYLLQTVKMKNKNVLTLKVYVSFVLNIYKQLKFFFLSFSLSTIKIFIYFL